MTRWQVTCYRMAYWSPRPWIGESWGGDHISWWFSRRSPDTEYCFEANWLGRVWTALWFKLAAL